MSVIFITTSDGQFAAFDFGYTRTDENGTSISFQVNFFYLVFENRLPLQLEVHSLLLTDSASNAARYYAGQNMSAPVITIRYPDSWYSIPSMDSSSNETSISSTTNSTKSTDTSSTNPTKLPYHFDMLLLFVLPVVIKFKRKSKINS